MINKDFLNDKEYDFLKPMQEDIILLGLGGSHAYGTNIETSDIDLRGVALNSRKHILLGTDFENVVNVNTDTTIYSTNKFIDLVTNCNPNTIELLGLRKEDYLKISPLGECLLDNKKLFLSKKCVNSFGGYANQQLYRLQQKTLCAMSDEEYNAHIARVLNNMKDHLNSKYGITDPIVELDNGELILTMEVNKLPLEHVTNVLSEINNTYREYTKVSHRNENAMTHAKIAKHSMHLIRLYAMGIDLMETGEIITYREKDHDLLMDIRAGKYIGSDGKPNKEFFNLVKEYETKFTSLKQSTKLPDTPNYVKIEQLKMYFNAQSLWR